RPVRPGRGRPGPVVPCGSPRRGRRAPGGSRRLPEQRVEAPAGEVDAVAAPLADDGLTRFDRTAEIGGAGEEPGGAIAGGGENPFAAVVELLLPGFVVIAFVRVGQDDEQGEVAARAAVSAGRRPGPRTMPGWSDPMPGRRA